MLKKLLKLFLVLFVNNASKTFACIFCYKYKNIGGQRINRKARRSRRAVIVGIMEMDILWISVQSEKLLSIVFYVFLYFAHLRVFGGEHFRLNIWRS